jgi:hypothetical protein
VKIFIPVSALWARYLEPAYLPVISVAQHHRIAVKKERQKTTRGRFFTGAEGGPLSYLSLFSTDLITTYSCALAPSSPLWCFDAQVRSALQTRFVYKMYAMRPSLLLSLVLPLSSFFLSYFFSVIFFVINQGSFMKDVWDEILDIWMKQKAYRYTGWLLICTFHSHTNLIRRVANMPID